MPPKYQKKSQLEHILLRPDTYVGSLKEVTDELYVIPESQMEKKTISYVQGFMKIFDEILVNAIDHSVTDSTVSYIKVEIDQKTNSISVMNDGHGIPVEWHSSTEVDEAGNEKKIECYTPELIFGYLLTSSNYNDNEQRMTGGRNGYGSKLAVIFSKEFTLETLENGKYYKQIFSNNMRTRSKPEIKNLKKKSFTKITYIPDLARFGMKNISDEVYLLLQKRVYDACACTNKKVKIYFNNEHIKIDSFEKYVDLYIGVKREAKRVYTSNKYWEVAVAMSETGFEQISFVNGICTTKGGKHVDYITNQISKKLIPVIEKKAKKLNVKWHMLKDNLFVFIKCNIVNPEFDSQTKETLKTPMKDFGTSIDLDDTFIERIGKLGIIDEVLAQAKYKAERDEAKELSKNDRGNTKKTRVNVKKLDDANWAGTRNSDKCTLILTEGLSAATFAVAGISAVPNGKDRFGIYPLKGKCISEDTDVLLWNGEIKKAKDIEIGDELIGDDGLKRNVLTLFKGNGEMYEVEQNRGMNYKVNDEHILTLCYPEHKSYTWNKHNLAWVFSYWDNNIKHIKHKTFFSGIKVNCNVCDDSMLSSSLKRHYNRKHNCDYIIQNNIINENDENITKSYYKMIEFSNTIDENNIFDITIKDYINNLSVSERKKIHGVRGDCVKWDYQNINIDPYVLGLWLGDGMKDGYNFACNADLDIEILNYLNKWGIDNDANFKKGKSNEFTYHISSLNNYKGKNKAPLRQKLIHYNLINNKHIPKEYLINSKEVRLKLLAGLIDTDGYVYDDGPIEISQTYKHKRLVDDIVYLTRSLGFYTTVIKRKVQYKWNNEMRYTDAYRIKFSGNNVSEIPTLLQRKKCINTNYNINSSTGPIKVTCIDNENYVGIGINGNNRFLINDFTVTHNCLNIREATKKQLLENEEINDLKKILGLQQGKEYKSTNELRYGSVLILTDADNDGFHIRGLILNMFEYWWPSLILKNYVTTMNTPIIKATKGREVQEFYRMNEYISWKENTPNSHTWTVKYYKGLGTSTPAEAKEIFKRQLIIKYNRDQHTEKTVKLAFERKQADNRKTWLMDYTESQEIEGNEVSVTDFINKELIDFSIADVKRSIPSMVDGFKPTQRKVLFGCLKRNLVNEVKVAQLSGYISEHAAYHHGEVSLQGTIVNMAQDFVGSNNINLLKPVGGFGSRVSGGKDSASARYIFTELQPITKILFNDNDNKVLKYLDDDGQSIEPEYYIPIIPMLLVNGADGIGTGFSTSIPCYNPDDIISNIKRLMNNQELIPMKPWYKGFIGDIRETDVKGKYITEGKYTLDKNKLTITELPIYSWTQNYKEFLEDKLSKDEIKDYQNYSTDTIVKFEVHLNNPNVDILKEFKLTSSISTSNMHAFDSQNKIKKYLNVESILEEYYTLRMKYYQDRKDYIIDKLQYELEVISNKVRFILEIIGGTLQVNNVKKKDLENTLLKKKYYQVENSFNYLTSLPIYTLTREKVEELKSKKEQLEEELNIVVNTTLKEMYNTDLECIKN